MTKAKELRDISDEQIALSVKEAREELFRMRIRSKTERQDAKTEKRRLRREIARLLTIQRERELATERQGAALAGG